MLYDIYQPIPQKGLLQGGCANPGKDSEKKRVFHNRPKKRYNSKKGPLPISGNLCNLGAFPALRAGNRAIRSNKKPDGFLFRFYPLRVPKSGFLPDFGIGVCRRQTPSIRSENGARHEFGAEQVTVSRITDNGQRMADNETSSTANLRFDSTSR
jgi:hypothetical protein